MEGVNRMTMLNREVVSNTGISCYLLRSTVLVASAGLWFSGGMYTEGPKFHSDGRASEE